MENPAGEHHVNGNSRSRSLKSSGAPALVGDEEHVESLEDGAAEEGVNVARGAGQEFGIHTRELSPFRVGKAHVFRELERRDVEVDWKFSTSIARPVTPVNTLGPMGPPVEVVRQSLDVPLGTPWNTSTKTKAEKVEVDTEPLGTRQPVFRELAPGTTWVSSKIKPPQPVLDTEPLPRMPQEALYRSLERRDLHADWKSSPAIKRDDKPLHDSEPLGKHVDKHVFRATAEGTPAWRLSPKQSRRADLDLLDLSRPEVAPHQVKFRETSPAATTWNVSKKIVHSDRNLLDLEPPAQPLREHTFRSEVTGKTWATNPKMAYKRVETMPHTPLRDVAAHNFRGPSAPRPDSVEGASRGRTTQRQASSPPAGAAEPGALSAERPSTRAPGVVRSHSAPSSAARATVQAQASSKPASAKAAAAAAPKSSKSAAPASAKATPTKSTTTPAKAANSASKLATPTGPATRPSPARDPTPSAKPVPSVKGTDTAAKAKLTEPSPAPKPKAAEPSPAPKAKAAEPSPAPKPKAAAPSPAPKAKAAEPSPVPKAKAAEPSPAPKAKAAEPSPVPKAKAAEPAPKPKAPAAPKPKSAEASPAKPKPEPAAPKPKAEVRAESPPKAKTTVPAVPAPVKAKTAPSPPKAKVESPSKASSDKVALTAAVELPEAVDDATATTYDALGQDAQVVASGSPLQEEGGTFEEHDETLEETPGVSEPDHAAASELDVVETDESPAGAESPASAAELETLPHVDDVAPEENANSAADHTAVEPAHASADDADNLSAVDVAVSLDDPISVPLDRLSPPPATAPSHVTFAESSHQSAENSHQPAESSHHVAEVVHHAPEKHSSGTSATSHDVELAHADDVSEVANSSADSAALGVPAADDFVIMLAPVDEHVDSLADDGSDKAAVGGQPSVPELPASSHAATSHTSITQHTAVTTDVVADVAADVPADAASPARVSVSSPAAVTPVADPDAFHVDFANGGGFSEAVSTIEMNSPGSVGVDDLLVDVAPSESARAEQYRVSSPEAASPIAKENQASAATVEPATSLVEAAEILPVATVKTGADEPMPLAKSASASSSAASLKEDSPKKKGLIARMFKKKSKKADDADSSKSEESDAADSTAPSADSADPAALTRAGSDGSLSSVDTDGKKKKSAGSSLLKGLFRKPAEPSVPEPAPAAALPVSPVTSSAAPVSTAATKSNPFAKVWVNPFAPGVTPTAAPASAPSANPFSAAKAAAAPASTATADAKASPSDAESDHFLVTFPAATPAPASANSVAVQPTTSAATTAVSAPAPDAPAAGSEAEAEDDAEVVPEAVGAAPEDAKKRSRNIFKKVFGSGSSSKDSVKDVEKAGPAAPAAPAPVIYSSVRAPVKDTTEKQKALDLVAAAVTAFQPTDTKEGPTAKKGSGAASASAPTPAAESEEDGKKKKKSGLMKRLVGRMKSKKKDGDDGDDGEEDTEDPLKYQTKM